MASALHPDGRELVSMPILVHDDLLGYVVGYYANDAEAEALYGKKLQLVTDFIGDKAYTEYELRNLTEELLEKYSEITLIYDISEALSAVLDQQAVCEIIIKQIVDVVRVERASIMLYDEESDCLHITASHGLELPEEEVQKIRVAPGEKVSGKVFSTGKHILIEDIQDVNLLDLPLNVRPYRKKSFLCIPIVFNSMNMERKVMGVINMADKISADLFTADDQRLLTAIASQAAMALYNIQLIEEVRDAERVRREMEIAQQIQTRLLPGEPPGIPGLDLAGRCLPATQVGGDYYDFFVHSDYELGVVIADVSGHDVGSAFIMATARSALRSEVLARKSPFNVLKETNYVLYNDLSRAEKFITMFYAEYDGSTNVLRYSNAAHNPPFLVRNGTCRLLDTDGMFIGMWESVNFEEKIIHLLPNDFVILYTDGVVEAKNEMNEMFTTERLEDVLAATPGHLTAQEVLEKIYQDVARFAGNAERSDDITVMVLKVQEPA
jgi:serine phosphatase RsbU (regulator of sigma subunit)